MFHLTASEAALALHTQINQTDIPFDAHSTVCDVWAQQVQAGPDAPAIVDLMGALSYDALDGLANSLAHRLVDAGVKPGDMVMLAMPRSREMVVALLAILKAGGRKLQKTNI